MSDEDQSGDSKGFLARWSQRKREAKPPDHAAPPVDAAVPSAPAAESLAGQEFDLSSLPKLEELTETTDITAFLRNGVPEHLRNAALRKSWALDPAIRNYVNPALEYAYDWNTPGGVPGSSEIGTGMDVARLVSQIMGNGEAAVEPLPAGTGNAPASDPGRPAQENATQETPDLPTQTLRLSSEAVSPAEEISTEDVSNTGTGQAEEPKESSLCCTAAAGATPWLCKAA